MRRFWKLRTRRGTVRARWFWLVALLLLIVLLGLIFGGYRKGTKVDSTGWPALPTMGQTVGGRG
jgi:hypothetical protein